MTENLISNGDYVPDGFGGFCRAKNDLLARALFKLTCKRGAFAFLPELGSRLHELGREKNAYRDQTAAQYAAEALRGMDLEVTGAKVTSLASGQADVVIFLRTQDANTSVEVRV